MTKEQHKLERIIELNNTLKELDQQMESQKIKLNKTKKEYDETLDELLQAIDSDDGPLVKQIEEQEFLNTSLIDYFPELDKEAIADFSEKTGTMTVGQLIEKLKAKSIKLSTYFNKAEAAIILDQLSSKIAEPDEEWRRFPMGELEGISPAILEKLEEAGIHTVGDAADFTAKDKDFSSIPGIGEASSEKVKNAIADYLAKRQK